MTELGLQPFLLLSAFLFACGVVCIGTKRNAIGVLMGVELVLNWLPTDNLRFGIMTTWRDAEATWEPFYDANAELVVDTSASTTDTDYTLTVGWAPELERGSLDVRIDYIFNENTSELDETSVVDASQYPGLFEDREDLNARIAWQSADERWTAALWGKNLLDQKRLGGVSDISVLFGTPFTTMDLPRTWGVEFEMRF